MEVRGVLALRSGVKVIPIRRYVTWYGNVRDENLNRVIRSTSRHITLVGVIALYFNYVPAKQPVPAVCQQDFLLCAYVQHQGDTLIMQKNYSLRNPDSDGNVDLNIGRDIEIQLALARYRRLKLLRLSGLTLDDELFVDNFEAAILLWWKVRLPN